MLLSDRIPEHPLVEAPLLAKRTTHQRVRDDHNDQTNADGGENDRRYRIVYIGKSLESCASILPS